MTARLTVAHGPEMAWQLAVDFDARWLGPDDELARAALLHAAISTEHRWVWLSGRWHHVARLLDPGLSAADQVIVFGRLVAEVAVGFGPRITVALDRCMGGGAVNGEQGDRLLRSGDGSEVQAPCGCGHPVVEHYPNGCGWCICKVAGPARDEGVKR